MPLTNESAAALVNVLRPQLATLAAAWLAAGASAFGFTCCGQTLASWPADAVTLVGEVSAPLTVDGAAVGTLWVAGLQGDATQVRLAADAALLALLAQQERDLDAVAEDLVQAQDQLLALYDLSRAARSHLSLPDTLTSLACETARLVATDGAVILYAPATGAPTLGVDGEAMPEAGALLAALTLLPTHGRELVLAGRAAAPYLAGRGRDLLLIPIRIHDKADAALALVRDYGRPVFTSPEIKLAHALAEQTGSQIENVLLYEETLAQARLETEMALARTVQMRLLPHRAPVVSGLALCARAMPALQVGGDFYDFIAGPAQGPHLMTFAVGDVSGKGLSAALIMAMARSVLRSNASGGVSPARVLDGANTELYDDMTEVAMFATMFIGQYDADRRTLRYANAGHSPVVYCPVGGPARLLEADGTALGVLPISLCADHELTFGPGALLVVCTDGFNEASNVAGEMFGYEHLLHLIESLADLPPEAIADALYAAVGTFAAGHPQEDDRTLIVAKGVLP